MSESADKQKRHIMPPLELHLDRVNTRSELREALIASKRSCEADFGDYLEMFWKGGHEGVYGTQRPGQGWISSVKKPHLNELISHLREEHWIGLRAPYFPVYAAVDVDTPRGSTRDAIKEIADKLELVESQFAVFTSPSFWKRGESDAGSLHVYFKATYNDNPASLKIHRWRLRPLIRELEYELFPQARKVFRLPFGRDQYYIDHHNGRVEFDLSWQDRLRILERLVPIDLKKYPYYGANPRAVGNLNRIDSSPQRKEAEELISTGLVVPSSRHRATGLLARWCFFQNFTPERAKVLTLDFLRRKHNGMSYKINRGNWSLVEKEVDNWIKSTYEYFESRNIYPDNVHNLQGWVTASDLKLICQLFLGDYINQKRCFKLVSYLKPRQRGSFAPMHWKKWKRLIGGEHCSEFKKAMIEKGLEIKDSYKVGAYPKGCRLSCLTCATESDILKDQSGRAIQNYKQALLKVCKTLKEAVAFSGASPDTLRKG